MYFEGARGMLHFACAQQPMHRTTRLQAFADALLTYADALDRPAGFHQVGKFKAWARDAVVTGPAQ
eukprot:4595223-Pyramimonas_sp.AAC.1